ncbi:hypothetical protein HPDFL43_00007640 [Hoeflea phototrophica DFL-43]|uniref:Uncharacterized protein n=2 Tax=Hoeflea TaxID=274591 RepID=A0A094Z299_HOEPD|nr:hypothetical protein HPDFL43_00007640 [Hoeflea phototrophica DFL-43]
MLKLNDASTKRYLRNTLRSQPCTFLLGSGISLFSPSNLPSGQSLVDEVSDLLTESEKGQATYHQLREFVRSCVFEHIFEHYPAVDRIKKEYFSQYFLRGGCNPIHESIARISARCRIPIITTNYDMMIERAFDKLALKNAYRSIVSSSALPLGQHIPIFKVHGCASNPVSIVLRMSEEGLLSGWKGELFENLVAGRTLIVVGYSGLDLEICPAIEEARPASIFWNVLRENDISQNARHLENNAVLSRNFTFLEGDMRHIFQVKKQIVSEKTPPIKPVIHSQISQQEIENWRFDFFNSLGAARSAHNTLLRTYGPISPKKISAVYYRYGRYVSSHLEFTKSVPNGAYAELSILLNRCTHHRNAGKFFSPRISLLMAMRLWSKLSFSHKRKHFDLFQWCIILLYPLRKSDVYKRSAQRLARYYLKNGIWGGFYNLQIELKEQGNIDFLPPPMQAHKNALEGYEQIGNISAYIDEFSRNSYRGVKSKSEFYERMKIAEIFGLYPNIYKICYAALCARKTFFLYERYVLYGKFIHSMSKCEYSLVCRLMLIARGTLALLHLRRKKIT